MGLELLYQEAIGVFDEVGDINDLEMVEPIIERLLLKHLEMNVRENGRPPTPERFDDIKTRCLVTIQRAYLTVCDLRRNASVVELSKEQVESIARQVEKQFQCAFWDKLSSDLEATPPQLSHLLVLLTEVRDRLDRLTPNNRSILRANKENIDLDYLRSQFNRSDSDWLQSLLALLETIVYFLVEERFRKMVAPVNDRELDEWWLTVQDLMKSGQPLHQMVPEIFKGVYKWLELIETGVRSFYKLLKN